MSKKGLAALLNASEEMKQCVTSVTEDTKDSAAFTQVCKFGSATTKTVEQMKRLSSDTIETLMTVNSGGPVIKTVSTTKLFGACSAIEKNKAASERPKQCTECRANVKNMKAKCAVASAQEQTICGSMVKQFEGMCSMSCQ